MPPEGNYDIHGIDLGKIEFRRATFEEAQRIDKGERVPEFKNLEVDDKYGPTVTVRKFDTGATRDSDEGKNDYEGYLSPLFLKAYGDYMTEHRRLSDGTLRASDNWQKGMPIATYRSSLIRHVFTAWALWRGWPVKDERIGGVLRQPTLKESLLAAAFNIMGYVHELERSQIGYAAFPLSRPVQHIEPPEEPCTTADCDCKR